MGACGRGGGGGHVETSHCDRVWQDEARAAKVAAAKAAAAPGASTTTGTVAASDAAATSGHAGERAATAVVPEGRSADGKATGDSGVIIAESAAVLEAATAGQKQSVRRCACRGVSC